MNKAQARIQFANWLKENHPNIFNAAIKKAGAGELGADEPATKSFWQKFTDAATGLGTTYLALRNQKEAMKINLARAQAGQPPIDVASSAPVVRTQVDLSPQLQSRLISTAGEGLNKTLLYGGLAFLGFLMFKKYA